MAARVSPRLRPKLEELSPELREAVLARDADLRSLNDLVAVLAEIVREAES